MNRLYYYIHTCKRTCRSKQTTRLQIIGLNSYKLVYMLIWFRVCIRRTRVKSRASKITIKILYAQFLEFFYLIRIIVSAPSDFYPIIIKFEIVYWCGFSTRVWAINKQYTDLTVWVFFFLANCYDYKITLLRFYSLSSIVFFLNYNRTNKYILSKYISMPEDVQWSKKSNRPSFGCLPKTKIMIYFGYWSFLNR